MMFCISLHLTLFRSYQFFIFMYTKLYYISRKIICHFLDFSSVFPITTKNIFSFWKLARKGQGKLRLRPMPPGKLLHPCNKSFQTHCGNRGPLSYLYWYYTCVPTCQHPHGISDDLYCKRIEAFVLDESICSSLRDSYKMDCYCNTDDLLQVPPFTSSLW